MTATASPKLSANERRALAEFAKPKVDWSKVHGNTRDSLQRKRLLDGHTLTPAGRTALAVPDIFADLFDKETVVPKKKPAAHIDAERPIEHVETTLRDWDPGNDDGGVRIYCTASPLTHGKDLARWALQLRARVKKKSGGEGKQFAVGTASMSREDLLWLRGQINTALAGAK